MASGPWSASTPADHGVPALFEILAEQEVAPPRCALEQEYGAALLLTRDRVAANFVSTIDGVASFGMNRDDSRAVGGGVVADRVLMAMLRALAGVILIGAGTLRAAPNHQWTPAALAPQRTDDLAALRTAAGLPDAPAPLLVVSGSGDLPAQAEAVVRPATPLHVLRSGGLSTVPAPREQPALPPADTAIEAAQIVASARSLTGAGPILCEGGPHLLGGLLAGAVPLDLFLTVAPQMAGRSDQSPQRRSLVEGVALPPFSRSGRLRSLRRAGDHLMLRYAIDAHHQAS